MMAIGRSLPPFMVKIVISASLRSPFSSKEILRGRLRRDSGLRAQQAVGGAAGELTHLVGAGSVAEREHSLDPELLALLEQGTGGGIHSAVEHRVRATALQLREDRLPV